MAPRSARRAGGTGRSIAGGVATICGSLGTRAGSAVRSGSLVSARCGAFPPVDGFCVGGHAVQEAGDELGVGAAAAGEAELPQFCGGPVVVVDRLIHGIGVDLPGAVAVGRCPDVAEQSGELRLVVGADPFLRGAPFGFGAHDATLPCSSQAGRGPGLTSVRMRDAGRRCRGAYQRYDRTPARRHDPLSGLLTLGSRPQRVAAQPGGRDEQISWATAERTAPDLACVPAVGYSVIAWIDGKEKVGGSIPPGGSTQSLDLRTYLFCLVSRPGYCRGQQREGHPGSSRLCSELRQRGRRPSRRATASAEQISGCRPDKFGPRPERIGSLARAACRAVPDTGRDRRPGSGYLADES
jgi:hypothetical protein